MLITCSDCGAPRPEPDVVDTPCKQCGSTSREMVLVVTEPAALNLEAPAARLILSTPREHRLEWHYNVLATGIEFLAASRTLDDGKHVLVSSTELHKLLGDARGGSADLDDGRI